MFIFYQPLNRLVGEGKICLLHILPTFGCWLVLILNPAWDCWWRDTANSCQSEKWRERYQSLNPQILLCGEQMSETSRSGKENDLQYHEFNQKKIDVQAVERERSGRASVRCSLMNKKSHNSPLVAFYCASAFWYILCSSSRMKIASEAERPPNQIMESWVHSVCYTLCFSWSYSGIFNMQWYHIRPVKYPLTDGRFLETFWGDAVYYPVLKKKKKN